MSLTWEAINDRSGQEAYQDDGTSILTRQKAWRVTTTSAATDDVTILADASAPKIGTAHPNDSSCYCVTRSARPEAPGQKLQWIFTADYSNKYDIRENPLLEPAVIEWSTEQFQEPVWRDRDGDAIVNSAGDPFDPPPEKDDSRWSAIVTKNVADEVPRWIFAYQDAINSSSFDLDGKEIATGEAKMQAIHLSTTQTRNEIDYRVLTMTMHFRGEGDDSGSASGSYGTGGGADEFEPWDLVLLDQGFRELSASAGSGSGSGSACDSGLQHIKNPCDGEFVTAPVPLDGEGRALDSPTPETAVFLEFPIYRERDFNSLSAVLT